MENDYRVMLLNFFKLYIYKKKNESLSKVNRSTVKKKRQAIIHVLNLGVKVRDT